MADVYRWLLWFAYVAALTTILIMPVPSTEGLPGHDFISTQRYVISKATHVVAYGVLTVLSATLPVPARYRWLLIFFVMTHGTLTELTQWKLAELKWSERTGTLQDVGFDNLGVLLGIAAGWKWWTREP
jgi:hypothetical protein